MKTLGVFLASALALTFGAASSSAASPAAALSYRGLDADIVGTVYEAKPDGHADGHFTLTLDTGGAAQTVTNIELDSTPGGVWDTVPQGTAARSSPAAGTSSRPRARASCRTGATCSRRSRR